MKITLLKPHLDLQVGDTMEVTSEQAEYMSVLGLCNLDDKDIEVEQKEPAKRGRKPLNKYI